MASSPGSRADAAYERARVAFEEKSYDVARRWVLDALAQNPQHPGARALLGRLDAARRPANPFQPASSGRAGAQAPGGARRGNAPEAISTDPTVLINRASAQATPQPIDPTVMIHRDDFLQRLTEREPPAAAPQPKRPAPRSVSEGTVISQPVSRPAASRPAPSSSAGGVVQSFWRRFQPRGRRPAPPPRRQSHAARDRPAVGHRAGMWTPGLRGALIAVAAVAVASLFVWGVFRAGRWFFPPVQVLALTPPVGGTILGPGLRCGTRGSECSATRPTGEAVELEAQPDANHVFSGFTGDCAPTGRITMSEPRACGARFDSVGGAPSVAAVTFPLTISKPTGGSVIAAGDILCGTLGSNCSAEVPSGAPVALRVQADTGYTFSQFTGDCAANGETTMTAARTCGATFTPSPLANVVPSGPVGVPERSRQRTPARIPTPPPPPASAQSSQPGAPAGPAPGMTGSTPGTAVSPSFPGGQVPTAAPPTATTPEKAAAPPITAEEHAKKEIQQLVKDFCAEYETLKPDRIQKLFPLVNQKVLRDQFREYKSLKCTATLPPEYDRLDASAAGGAQLKFGMKQVVQMKSNGAPATLETIVTMVVSRTDMRSPWLIDRVQHEPKPK